MNYLLERSLSRDKELLGNIYLPFTGMLTYVIIWRFMLIKRIFS